MKKSRRSFIKKAAVGAGIISTTSAWGKESNFYISKMKREKYSWNDQIQIAVMGAGGMGVADTNTALQIPGVKLVAACDLYQGRLDEAKERWGKDIYTTMDYKEILNRSDVDAVIIATPDHWHKQISVDAL
ncbi:MAG: Gfo/Idh/MocA family oxidoreductase, partial [Saprospiraceae bacterium]|nr:Gfo/Idh/MocA family oxidoreductase [Saprospiraceae bacterium]